MGTFSSSQSFQCAHCPHAPPGLSSPSVPDAQSNPTFLPLNPGISPIPVFSSVRLAFYWVTVKLMDSDKSILVIYYCIKMTIKLSGLKQHLCGSQIYNTGIASTAQFERYFVYLLSAKHDVDSANVEMNLTESLPLREPRLW